jgi:hypothetical protein
MALHDSFGMVVERIDDEQVHLGLPDTRGTYHQIQMTWEQVWELAQKIAVECGKETNRKGLEESRRQLEREAEELKEKR